MTASELPVPLADKPHLAAMLRAYVAEMATYAPDADPAMAYPYFDLYWSEPDRRFPFWLTVDDAEAGFALIRREPQDGRMQIAEYFVASPYRRQGIGRAGARRLIARFPGPWKITQRELNSGAIAFWHRVLDGFVTYDETTTSTDAVRRQQLFVYP